MALGGDRCLRPVRGVPDGKHSLPVNPDLTQRPITAPKRPVCGGVSASHGSIWHGSVPRPNMGLSHPESAFSQAAPAVGGGERYTAICVLPPHHAVDTNLASWQQRLRPVRDRFSPRRLGWFRFSTRGRQWWGRTCWRPPPGGCRALGALFCGGAALRFGARLLVGVWVAGDVFLSHHAHVTVVSNLELH